MTAIDTNILVYAHREDSEWHKRAAAAVASLAESAREWAIPWPCLHEFLAIVTHPRIFRTPTPLELAIRQLDAWLEAPTLVVLSENDDYVDSFREIVLSSRVSGPRVPRRQSRGVVSEPWYSRDMERRPRFLHVPAPEAP